MATFVYRNGKVVPKGSVDDVSPPWVTGVISDSMDPVKHHGTGRVIDSKSRFRADTKASGCVEVGDETIMPRQPIKLDNRQRRDDIRRAIYELKNG